MTDHNRGEEPTRPRSKDAGESHRRELARAKAIVARWIIEPREPGSGTAPGHIATE